MATFIPFDNLGEGIYEILGLEGGMVTLRAINEMVILETILPSHMIPMVHQIHLPGLLSIFILDNRKQYAFLTS